MRQKTFKTASDGILKVLEAHGHRIIEEADGWVLRHGKKSHGKHATRMEAIIAGCTSLVKDRQMRPEFRLN